MVVSPFQQSLVASFAPEAYARTLHGGLRSLVEHFLYSRSLFCRAAPGQRKPVTCSGRFAGLIGMLATLGFIVLNKAHRLAGSSHRASRWQIRCLRESFSPHSWDRSYAGLSQLTFIPSDFVSTSSSSPCTIYKYRLLKIQIYKACHIHLSHSTEKSWTFDPTTARHGTVKWKAVRTAGHSRQS